MDSFLGERDVYRLVAQHPEVPAPALVAHGFLFSEAEPWRWPYVITRVIPGTVFGEVRKQVGFEGRAAQAEFLGHVLRQLHDLAIDGCGHLRCSWDAFARFLGEQRATCADNHSRWNTLPEHLHAQLDEYLQYSDPLFDSATRPRVLHCDVVGKHVLGHLEQDHWRPTALIDFGDAKVGDPLYELVALHVGLFRCDKRLLRIFLRSYGLDSASEQRFVRRCMSYTLLHEFYIERPTFPGLRDTVGTLEELAALVWDLDAPGLPGSDS